MAYGNGTVGFRIQENMGYGGQQSGYGNQMGYGGQQMNYGGQQLMPYGGQQMGYGGQGMGQQSYCNQGQSEWVMIRYLSC